MGLIQKMIFIFLILVVSKPVGATYSLQKIAEGVLVDLYKANGNHVHVKPEIRIIDSEKDAALFLRRSNTIELSKKAYKICQSMGRDSLSALAYIIGHELAHAYQKDLKAKSTGFIAFDQQDKSSLFLEESADVQGVFLAYLAGYKTTHILQELINKIYEDFNLPDELTGYPTLTERLNTTSKVKAISTELIQIYEAGNYLIAIEKYELAIACFEYVESRYKGQEVYNNLGLAFTYLAMNFSQKNTEPFLFPLEISWTTRMKKPLGQRGGEDLLIEEQKLRKSYLQKAEKYFTIASKIAPQQLAPEVNLMCVAILQGKAKKAIEYYRRHGLAKRTHHEAVNSAAKERVRLALALAYVYNDEADRAIRIWEDIIASKDGLGAFQADFNLKIQIEGKCILEEKLVCPEISGTNTRIDNVKLHRPQTTANWISMSSEDEIQVIIDSKENSLTYIFKEKTGVFSIQRIFTPLSSIPKDIFSSANIFTNIGYISFCKNSRLAFLIDSQGDLIEWVKYY